MYKIVLEHKPRSQPRPRRAKKGFFYDPSSKDKEKLRKEAFQILQDQAFDPSLYVHYHVNMIFYMPFPSKWGKKKRADAQCNYAWESNKDLDNCAKYYCDLLPFNDKLITSLNLLKIYSFTPRVEIHLEGLTLPIN